MSKQEAIARAGNLSRLAELLGITPAAVSQWSTIPPARLWQLRVLKPAWFNDESPSAQVAEPLPSA